MKDVMGRLVLTRKLGERIIINHNIIVQVVALDANRVRLSVEADKTIPINREEVDDREEQE